MSVEYVPVSLPSKCKPYPNIEPGDIKLRPFTGKDEQLVAEMASGNPKKKILEILENVVQGINPSMLTAGDVSHIVLWEAINSYSSNYPIDMVCEHCYDEISVVIDLGRIDSKELAEEYSLDYEVKLPTKSVKMRLLTLADEIEIASWAQKGKSVYLYSYALSIIDSETNAYGRMLVLEELSTKELSKIRAYHSKFEHGPDFLAPYTCTHCGEDGRVVVPFRLDEIIQNDAQSGVSVREEV